MSFLFGSTKELPLPEQKAFGLDESRLVSDERGRPVPMIYGQQPIAVTPLSNPYNQRNVAIEEDVGKEEVVVGFNYYTDIGLHVCGGPVDKLIQIMFDGEEVWPLDGSGGVSRGAEDFITVTVEGFGQWRFYWGTETQTFDPGLVKLSQDTTRNPAGVDPDNVPEEHPAYVGQCYFVAENHFIGYNRTSLQNIEVVVGRYVAIPWLSSPNVLGDCDVAAILADALTNKRFGLGLRDASGSDTRLNRTSFGLFSTGLKNSCFSLSPKETRSQPFSQFLTKNLEVVDGFWREDENGRCELGLSRDADFDGSIPVIDESCLTRLPEVEVGSHNDTKNEVFVNFTNREDNWKKDSVPGYDAGNHALRDEPDPLVMEWPAITRPLMAHQIAQLTANVQGQVPMKGTLSVRKSKLQGLKAGDAFWWHYAPYGICHLPCRVLRKQVTDPTVPEVDLEFNVHRSPGGTFTGEGFVALPQPSFTPVAFTDQLVVELPYAPPSARPLIAFLAARPTNMTLKYKVWREQGVGSYGDASVKTIENFAWHGTLDAQLTASGAGPISVTLDGIDRELPGDITAQQGTEERVLALIGDEIFSVHTPIVTGTDQYTLEIIRERFDTKKKTHNAGADVWIIRKAHFLDNIWDATNVNHGDGQSQTFKLQPIVRGQALSLGDIANTISVTFSDRSQRHWKPRDLTGNGVGRAALTFEDGDDIDISWTPVNRDGGAFQEGALLFDLWVLEVRQTDNTLLHSETFAAGESSWTMAYSVWSQFLSPAQDFKLRIYATQNGYDSREYDEVTVTLV